MRDAFQFGEWLVEPALNRLSRNADCRQIEPLAMDVLVYLLRDHDRVVSVDEILDEVWRDRHGDPGMVKKRVAQIRSALEDDATHPRYIENIPKRGYRAIAMVSRRGTTHSGATRLAPISKRSQIAAVVSLVAMVALGAAWLWQAYSIPPMSNEETGPVEFPLTSVAVLPFDDLSPGRDHAWLADGMAEDLAEALGRIDALFIPARQSAAVLRDQGADLHTIGKRLGVGSVVVGSVRRVGEHLSVVAFWVRIEDGARLWSTRFDREFNDILAIQFEIATGVAEAIRTELGIQDTPAWLVEDRYSTVDVRAWELLKSAIALIETNEPSNVKQAREMLLTATQYDPGFANAHAQLAFADYYGDVERGIDRLKLVLQLDPSNQGALAILAWDSAMRFWDHETAWRLLKRIPEARKSAETWGVEMFVSQHLGLQEERLYAAEESVRRNPMIARFHCAVGFLYMQRGDDVSAVSSFKQAIAVANETGGWGVHCVSDLAKYYLRSGRESEVLSLMLEAPQYRTVDDEIIRRGWESGGWKGMHLAIADAYPSANSQNVSWKCDYITLAEAGAVGRMYSCLETELEETAPDVPASNFADTMRRFSIAGLLTDDAFDPYRTEPRFQNLVHRIDQRIRKARGTYERKSGFALAHQASPIE